MFRKKNRWGCGFNAYDGCAEAVAVKTSAGAAGFRHAAAEQGETIALAAGLLRVSRKHHWRCGFNACRDCPESVEAEISLGQQVSGHFSRCRSKLTPRELGPLRIGSELGPSWRPPSSDHLGADPRWVQGFRKYACSTVGIGIAKCSAAQRSTA